MIYAEKGKYAVVKAEAVFSFVTVVHPLTLCIFDILSCVLVFKFKGKNRNTVYSDNHINRFFAVCGVVPLSVKCNFVGGIQI